MRVKDVKHKVTLDNFEHRLLVSYINAARNVYLEQGKEGELNETSVVKDFLTTAADGKKANPRVVITFGDKREGNDDDVTSASIKKIKDYHDKHVKPLFGDNDEKYCDSVCEDFKNPEGEINMLIVKDMLLTGFDAPVAGVLYVDKTLQEHNLLQAIARVNRVYKGKDFGLIVDYWGIFKKLRTAVDLYDDAESSMNSYDQEDIEGSILGPIDEKNKLEASHEELWNMFADIDKNATSDTWQMSLEDDAKRNEFYEPSNVKADKIKTRIESELKQVRYDDPLLFEEFSTKIKTTLAEYDKTRDADKYFTTMEAMADDFRNGRMTKDYPVSIANDSDAKAFYGAVVTTVRSKSKINITDSIENTIADYSRRITKAVADNAKRDWKHNEVVHKQIHRALDDCLFDMFDEISVEIDNSNIEMLDIIIDEIMKVAVARY